MFVGVFVYSFLIGSISSIFYTLDKNESETRHMKEVLSRIHIKYNLPPKLLKTIRTALTHTTRSIIHEDIEEFLKELPKKYQITLGYEMYSGLLKNINFFQNKSKELIAFVGPRLSKSVYDEREVIYHRKEVADDSRFNLIYSDIHRKW